METLKKKKPKVTRSSILSQKPKTITTCSYCGDVQYKNVWYAPDSVFALGIHERKDVVFYSICPACQMKRDGQSAGILHIKAVPTDLDAQVMKLVFHQIEREYLEHPQYQVSEFAELVDEHKITTNSAEMIKHIGQKIKSHFGNCEVHSTYKKNPQPLLETYVVFTAPSFFV